MKRITIILTAFFALLAAGQVDVQAAVRLPSVFGDHMVVQRDTGIPVWGTADAGERLTVTLASHTAEAVADAEGRWRVTLAALAAGGPHELVVRGSETKRFRNVMVGEVWVCSGQSNMQWMVRQANDADAEIAVARHPGIRLFQVKRTTAEEPATDVEAQWAVCDPQSVGDFSAVAYYFGRALSQALDVPIGLIHTSWGGTPAEAWTRWPTLTGNPEFQPIVDRYTKSKIGYDEKLRTYEEERAVWDKEAAALRAAGKNPGRGPRVPYGPNDPHAPSVLFNGMIAPLIPYAFRGAIWYQGESNASRAYQYRALFPTMITDWRKAWGQGDFPFLFVQLANYKARETEPGESDWAELREAQTMTLSLPNTGMAVIIDIGEAGSIHPTNKQDVGKRLALWARAQTYGEDIVYSGPLYHSMESVDGGMRLRFDHAGGGLTAQGGTLKGFAIAGADRRFVWADARIDGQTVIVSSAAVKKPVAVRYGWADNPECPLYNREGLPASPFRTDDWSGITVGKGRP